MKSSRTVLFATVLACVYILLAVFDTRDVDLLMNVRNLSLPIVEASVPVVGFFVAGPLLLLILFGYLQLKLGLVLRKLARLPAVFPDGRRLSEGIYPWILASVVHAGYGAMRPSSARPGLFGGLTSALIGWGVVPLTLLTVWGRYLARHDPLVTSLHIAFVTMASVWGMVCFQKGRELGGRLGRDLGVRVPFPVSRVVLAGSALAAGSGVLSVLAMTGVSKLPNLPPVLNPYATLDGVDLRENEESGRGRRRIELAGVNLVRADATAVNASGVNLKGADLRLARCSGGSFDFADLDQVSGSGLVLTDGSLIAAKATGARFSDGDFRGACLQGAVLSRADLSGADLRYADLTGVNLEGADLRGAKLTGARLDCANLFDANLSGAILHQASLKGAVLVGADLSEAHLRGAWLTRVRARRANFTGAHLVGAILTYGEFTEGEFSRSEMGGAWLDGATLRRVGLVEANLDEASLRGADLAGARLTGAQMRSADLRSANLLDADLKGARLSLAYLHDARLDQATLEGAALNGAILDGASLQFATLREADFRDAHIANSTGWDDAYTEGILNLQLVSCTAEEAGEDHHGRNFSRKVPEVYHTTGSPHCIERAKRLATEHKALQERLVCEGLAPARVDGSGLGSPPVER